MSYKTYAVLAAVSLFICCIPLTGHSAIVASDATVVSAGPYGSGATSITVFYLKVGTATTAKYFKAPAGREKEMLAVAIAALTNSRKVRLYKLSTSLGATTPTAATLIVGMELK